MLESKVVIPSALFSSNLIVTMSCSCLYRFCTVWAKRRFKMETSESTEFCAP